MSGQQDCFEAECAWWKAQETPWWSKDPKKPLERATPEHLRCVRLARCWLGGLQCLPRNVIVTGPASITLLFERVQQLSTYDGSDLTALVLLAHDHGVRADVGVRERVGMNPRPPFLQVALEARARDGKASDRHPTIETALTDWRKIYPTVAL